MHGHPKFHWLNDDLSNVLVIFFILDSNGECMLRPTDHLLTAVNGTLAIQSKRRATTLRKYYSIVQYGVSSFHANLNFCYADCRYSFGNAHKHERNEKHGERCVRERSVLGISINRHSCLKLWVVTAAMMVHFESG